MFRFRPGDKVVCIGDFSRDAEREWARDLCIELPQLGTIYTIRSVHVREAEGEEHPCVLLQELLNMPCTLTRNLTGGWVPIEEVGTEEHPIDEIAWHQDSFRPLLTVGTFVEVEQREPIAA